MKTEINVKRLKRLHAKALGLYMAFRMNGHDGEVQRRRLERIEEEIEKVNGQAD